VRSERGRSHLSIVSPLSEQTYQSFSYMYRSERGIKGVRRKWYYKLIQKKLNTLDAVVKAV
jgi:hypothetical protein